MTDLARHRRTGNRDSARAGDGDRRRTRFRRLAACGLALAVVLVVGGGTFALWPRTSTLDSKTVCLHTGSVADLTAFSRLTGRPVNCVVMYNDANPGWAGWVTPWFATPNDTDWTQWLKADPAVRRMVVTQEMVPDDVPANWRVLGAEGAYDHYARELAVNLVAAGMGNAIIRLGHEMNGNWYHDSLGNNPAQFGDWAAYWARIVRVMRSVQGAHFLFDWNVNAGYRDIPLNSFYPGNDVVDMIGIDIYDTGMPGNPGNQAARWASLDREPDGLAQILAFARAHGKPLSFPEWGVVSSANGGAGDDPGYVQGIISTIKDNNVVYQSYFDRPTGGVLLLENTRHALSLWEKYFGPGGTLSGRPW
jgi:hypothetical protein